MAFIVTKVSEAFYPAEVSPPDVRDAWRTVEPVRMRGNARLPSSGFSIGFRIGGWHWNFGPVAMVLFGAVAIAVFARELIEDQREKEHLASEFEAGRAMQQILLGSQLPVIPGFHIELVYKAAAEVGGDFYQVLPLPSGVTILVVGDVSGKGLKAAMTGTLVLGALCSLAQEDLSPAQILTRLNAQLAGAFDGGFVTCLCARINQDGVLTLANAGRLSPYRNGAEVKIESSLPLGIALDAPYAESGIRLTPGDELTFLSDGVVEAQNQQGELFGFDRTAAISTQSAERIAAAAQAHGQEDDITVLSLQYAPTEVLHV